MDSITILALTGSLIGFGVFLVKSLNSSRCSTIDCFGFHIVRNVEMENIERIERIEHNNEITV